MEMHERMNDQRNDDQKAIRERCERIKQMREQRFEQLLEELLQQDELKCSVAGRIRQRTQDEFKKQSAIYNDFNQKVFGRIQGKLDKYLNPPPPKSFLTPRGVEFQPRLSSSSAETGSGQEFQRAGSEVAYGNG